MTSSSNIFQLKSIMSSRFCWFCNLDIFARFTSSLKRKSSFFDNEDLLDSTAPVAPAPAEAEAEPVALAVLAQWNAYLVYEGDLPDFPLLFWPSYMNEAPDLGHVAEIYTGIKHSQVKVEGLFSVTGHLTLDRRSRTGVERLDDICYIWSNYPRTPKPPGKESEASRNQAIVLPEFFPDEQPDWADSPAGEFDEAAALQENEALAEVDVGQNGYADLPVHLDPIFDVGTDLDGLKEVDLDLDDLGYESVLFADLDQVLRVNFFLADNWLDNLIEIPIIRASSEIARLSWYFKDNPLIT